MQPDGPILVVEDDRDVRQTIQWVLEDEGWPVLTASDGMQAVQEAERAEPRLVLLDMGLPILDGFAVADRLRATYGDDLRIVVITADGRAAEKAARVGAVTYLHKPFDIQLLIDAVQFALRQ